MLVDALTVMLPDDPQGNAKLMFSILDCLPKVNRTAREAEAASARSARPSHLDSGRRKSGPGSRMTTPRTTPRTTPTSQSPGSESDSSPNPPVNLRSKLVLTPMTTTTTAGSEGGGGTASGPSAPGSTSTTSTPTSSITSPPSTTAAPISTLPPGATEAASTLTATRGLDPDTETEEDKDGAETTSS
ncbi:hypothetical protein Pcinc_027966 [Petrolisthes cinctipes]|uniref:Uncharacterized protein n=1 Tax=Petrolisthes cinctipes TaxID=88211 RepID=A0AAE1F2V6_PETCI|nr:hypothetical protein Pcinc_027966 [Petrolisthes cinctipes]